MNKKFFIILNPAAGKGHAVKNIPTIQEFFEKHDLQYEIHLTERPGHAIQLAGEFCNQPGTAVIAAGGDGTCNEVINGLMLTRINEPKMKIEPVFGVLPIGRGNDFAYGAGVPATLKESLNALIHCKPVYMDVGLIIGGDYPKGRYFGNGIGVGFDTIVGLEAAKMKHIHGASAYFIGALKTLILYPPAPDIELTYNDVTSNVSPALVSIMNGKRMGGTFFMAPNASNNDGVLNMCLTRQGNRRELLKTMIHYIKGTQHNLENTTTAQNAAFKLKALSGSLAAHADGETICIDGKELEISCIPKALKIISRG